MTDLTNQTAQKPTALLITMRDMRRVGFCAAGVEAFFMREGLDYLHFVRHGIDAQILLDTGSALARKCIDAAVRAAEAG